jgi:hypothetical protein
MVNMRRATIYILQILVAEVAFCAAMMAAIGETHLSESNLIYSLKWGLFASISMIIAGELFSLKSHRAGIVASFVFLVASVLGFYAFVVAV